MSKCINIWSKNVIICHHIIKAMSNFLKNVNSKEEVRDILIPNPDNWIWKEETVLKARKEVWGY